MNYYLEAKRLKEILQIPVASRERENSKSLGDFLKEYLSERAQDHSQATIDMDSVALRLLSDVVGQTTLLHKITEKDLLRFRDVCTLRDVKPIKTVSMNTYFRHLRAAFNWAKKKKYLDTPPVMPFFRIKEKPLPSFLKPEELDRIMEKAKEMHPDFYPLMVFYLWTATRRSEALPLKWGKVFLDSKNPYVIVIGKGRKERMIPLMPEAVKILLELKPVKPVKPTKPVFRQIHKSTATHWFKKICRACDPPVESRLHHLRHTAAAYMLSKDIPMKMVQDVLGHTDIATTVNIYGGVLQSALFKEMGKLNFKA